MCLRVSVLKEEMVPEKTLFLDGTLLPFVSFSLGVSYVRNDIFTIRANCAH